MCEWEGVGKKRGREEEKNIFGRVCVCEIRSGAHEILSGPTSWNKQLCLLVWIYIIVVDILIIVDHPA